MKTNSADLTLVQMTFLSFEGIPGTCQVLIIYYTPQYVISISLPYVVCSFV